MADLVLVTTSNPGQADWKDSTLIPALPVGPAGGDLAATYPNPLVVGFNGIPIDLTAPSNGDALLYNSGTNQWTHAPITFSGGPPTGPAGGDLGGLYPNPIVDGLQTRPVSAAAPAINDSLVWNGAAWAPQAVGAGAITAVYGQFISTVDQALTAGVPAVLTYTATTAANGISVVAGSQLTVAQSGIYEFTVSLQMLHTGGTTVIIRFWARKNGTNLPNSASSIEMGNNNNRTLPFVVLIEPMLAGEQIEWVVETSGTNTSVEHFNEVTGPPAIPAIPSIIAGVKRLGS